MRPTDKKIENLIQNLNENTRPELDARILDECFNELENTKSAPVRSNIWSTIMHSKLTKPIAAVIIFSVILIGFNLLGVDSASKAYAAAFERVE